MSSKSALVGNRVSGPYADAALLSLLAVRSLSIVHLQEAQLPDVCALRLDDGNIVRTLELACRTATARKPNTRHVQPPTSLATT